MKFLLLFSFVLLFNACSAIHTVLPSEKKGNSKQTNKSLPPQLKSSDYHQSCQFLFNKDKKPLAETMLWDCFVETQIIAYPQLINKLLLYKPALTKKHLAIALDYMTRKKETTIKSKLVKKLLDAGAPTSNLSLNNILIQRADVCASVTLIIKNNLRLYKDARPEYLHMLTQINRGYASCPQAIKLLVSYNPRLRNVQDFYGMTPLHNYLIGVDHPKWDLNIAKLLITRRNINLKDKRGYTPLHYIQLYMTKKKRIYSALIQAVDKHSNTQTDKVALQQFVESLILKNRPKCLSLINNKPLNQKNITACFSFYAELETPYLINKLLEHKPTIPKHILNDLIALLANDMSNAVHTKSLEKLIKAGASTEDIVVPFIIYGGNFSCNTLKLVLKKNSELYKDPHFLRSTPKTEDNSSSPRNTDLHGLSAVGLERGICPESIQFLAKNHPHLRDVQETYSNSTPLHIYLGDTHWPDWDLETLRTLISKNNINLQDNYGDTPMHKLNSGAGSDNIGEHEIRIIKILIEYGADVTIKNNNGKSPRDLFEDKNSKLKMLFQEIKKK